MRLNAFDFKTIGLNQFATKNILSEKHVNENDEVLFSGLFTNFAGSQKNYPIVRHGKVALLPGEDIATDKDKPDKKTQIYMAEITSFGGNSGSPVFLRIGGIRENLDMNLNLGGYDYLLLGVMSGYYPDDKTKQNSGIAIVVPVDKINSILASDLVKALFAKSVVIDKTREGDLKAAEVKFKESIAILERQAPESSQLINVYQDYAAMLKVANRILESTMIERKALKIKGEPLSKVPIP